MPRNSAQKQNSQPDLLIAAASARAMAQSARNAGLHVVAADLFGDTDLREVADDVFVVKNWHEELVDWSRRFSIYIPLIYGGGLENHADVLQELQKERTVAGVVGKPLDTIRHPESLFQWCRSHSIPCPSIGSKLRPGHRAVRKSRLSTAGLGVGFDNGQPVASTEYLQEYVDGEPVSAGYLISAAQCQFLGWSESIPTTQSAHAPRLPFLYTGSITRNIKQAPQVLLDVGHALHQSGYRGLLGADFIQTDAQSAMLLEINPRYTASMELFERHTSQSLVQAHLKCFNEVSSPKEGSSPQIATLGFSENATDHSGKLIVYAPHNLQWDRPSHVEAIWESMDSCPIADIPADGTVIPAGDPVCTLFANSTSTESCRAELLTRQELLLDLLIRK